MSGRPKPDIGQTAIEKVLIKHQAMTADRYQKLLIDQAKKQVTEYCQQAQSEMQQIQQAAYQQGYQDGVRKLLADLLQGVELSQRQYQRALEQSQTRLQALLSELFNDPRLYDIISDHFINLHPDASQIRLYLPSSLIETLKPALAEMQHITLVCSTEQGLALEVDNEIIHFSPAGAAQRTLPQILSLPARCEVLHARKHHYQQLTELLNRTGDQHDYFATPLNPEQSGHNADSPTT